jgi:H+/Cl- antiporter ClcA
MRLKNLWSFPHWKSRLLLWGAAAAVGLAAVTFAWLADVAQTALRRLVAVSPWWPWLLAPAGFFLIAWLTQRYFRGAEGSGIPQTIFALRPNAGVQGEALMKPMWLDASGWLRSACFAADRSGAKAPRCTWAPSS